MFGERRRCGVGLRVEEGLPGVVCGAEEGGELGLQSEGWGFGGEEDVVENGGLEHVDDF